MAGPRKCKGCGGAVKGHQGPVGMGKCKNSPVESEQIEQEDVPQAEADHVISGASEQEASEPETAKKTKGKPSSKSSPTDSPDITGEKTASKPGRKKREEKEVEMVDREVVDTASEKAAPTSKRGKKAAKKVEEDPETEESTDPAKNELAAGDKAEDSDTEDRDGEQRAQPEETSEDLEPNKSKRGRKKKMSSDLDESDAEKENKEPSAETPVKETKKSGKAKQQTKDEKEEDKEEGEEAEEEKEEGAWAEEEEEQDKETSFEKPGRGRKAQKDKPAKKTRKGDKEIEDEKEDFSIDENGVSSFEEAESQKMPVDNNEWTESETEDTPKKGAEVHSEEDQKIDESAGGDEIEGEEEEEGLEGLLEKNSEPRSAGKGSRERIVSKSDADFDLRPHLFNKTFCLCRCDYLSEEEEEEDLPCECAGEITFDDDLGGRVDMVYMDPLDGTTDFAPKFKALKTSWSKKSPNLLKLKMLEIEDCYVKSNKGEILIRGEKCVEMVKGRKFLTIFFQGTFNLSITGSPLLMKKLERKKNPIKYKEINFDLILEDPETTDKIAEKEALQLEELDESQDLDTSVSLNAASSESENEE